MLFLTCGSDLAQRGRAMSDDAIKGTILSVQIEVGDLTNPAEPLNCKRFLAARKSMSKETARQIVKLIERGALTNTQSEIAVLLLSSLPEAIYWRITEPLVVAKTEQDVLKAVLLPPLPYGPGYANAFREDDYSNKLVDLRDDPKCARELKAILDLILSRRASKIYRDYLKHPGLYGYRVY